MNFFRKANSLKKANKILCLPYSISTSSFESYVNLIKKEHKTTVSDLVYPYGNDKVAYTIFFIQLLYFYSLLCNFPRLCFLCITSVIVARYTAEEKRLANNSKYVLPDKCANSRIAAAIYISLKSNAVSAWSLSLSMCNLQPPCRL